MHEATLLAARRGFNDEAADLARLGVKVATEAADQDRFRMLAAAFERDSASPIADATVAPASEPAPARTGPVFPQLP